MKSKQAALIPAPQQAALTKALTLKGEIVACHQVTLRAGNEMVQAAYRCGELLTEVREVLKAGKTTTFENWIEQFLPFNRSAAYSYIKLATDLGKIGNVRSRGQIIASADTISEAKRLIAAVLPAAPTKSTPTSPPSASQPSVSADQKADLDEDGSGGGRVDDPLYFPTEDGPDVEPDLSENMDAEPPPADEPPAKAVKNGAEKVSAAKLVDEAIRTLVSPLAKALLNIAKANGGKGEQYELATDHLNEVLTSLKEMKGGTK